MFYEATGLPFDDAGFAHLPSGPFPELDTGWFEPPRFEHLGGPRLRPDGELVTQLVRRPRPWPAVRR